MGEKNRFAKNIGLYAIGTFATRILQFLFVPIYSKYIDTSDMGTYNVILAIVAIAVPLLFQSIWEGTFRFTIDKGNDGRQVLSNNLKYCICLLLLYSVIFLLIAFFIQLQYAFLIWLFVVGHVVAQYWQFAARALEENKAYTYSSVVSSAVSIFLNLILIIVFKFGIYSLFIANIAGLFAMAIILESKIHLLQDLFKYQFDKRFLIEIIKYSMPLAINYVSWWLMDSCNSIIIVSSVGTSQNGIYAMAMKFGAILTMVTGVVSLAWQEESFRTYGEKGQYQYFNIVFCKLSRFLLTSVMVLIPTTFIIYKYLIFGDYKTGVGLVFFIYLSATFSALAYHLGSAFLARKESSIMFYTTLIGGVANMIVSLVLVNIIGIWGAAIGTFIGNIVNFGIRIPLLQRRIPININSIQVIALTTICIIEGYLCIQVSFNLVIQIVILLIGLLIMILLNKEIFDLGYNKIKSHFNRS